MRRGDIVRMDLPTPINAPGHEQIGFRPALIVHSNNTIDQLSVVMIVPFTTTTSASAIPYSIEISPSRENGLLERSVILVSQLRAIDKKRYKGTMGRLEPEIMNLVEEEIRKMLDLQS